MCGKTTFLLEFMDFHGLCLFSETGCYFADIFTNRFTCKGPKLEFEPLYSGDLKSDLVWISNCPKQVGLQMVWISKGI